jgi:hypothetical protein
MRDLDIVKVFKGLGSLAKGKAKIDMKGQAKRHDMSILFAKPKRRGIFGQCIKIHGKEIHGEFTVDVAKLVLVFFLKPDGFTVHRFKIVTVIGAFVIDAFVDDKEFPVFLRDKDMVTVRALEFEWLGGMFPGDEGLKADFALILSMATVIVIEIVMGGTADRADSVNRNGLTISTIDRLKRPNMFKRVVLQQLTPVLFLKPTDDWQDISLEFLIFGRMDLIMSPLAKRDVFGDEKYQPTNLLILVLDN